MTVNKLATALAVIFVVSLIALAGELLYVLWRRHAFRRRGADPQTTPAGETPSKELLYFLCLKSQSRIQPAGPAPEPPASIGEDQVIDVFKLLGANGPSRVLCTIKEEEREDGTVESPPEKPEPRFALFSDKMDEKSKPGFALFSDEDPEKPEPGFSLFSEEVAEKPEPGFALFSDEVDVDGGTTPFETPCATPQYFTPAASPERGSGRLGVMSID